MVVRVHYIEIWHERFTWFNETYCTVTAGRVVRCRSDAVMVELWEGVVKLKLETGTSSSVLCPSEHRL